MPVKISPDSPVQLEPPIIHEEFPPRVQSFSWLPGDALMSANDIVALSGRSRSSIWRDVKRGLLPKPIRVGLRSARWRVHDIRKYLNGEQIR